jgi:hypothetical protein
VIWGILAALGFFVLGALAVWFLLYAALGSAVGRGLGW